MILHSDRSDHENAILKTKQNEWEARNPTSVMIAGFLEQLQRTLYVLDQRAHVHILNLLLCYIIIITSIQISGQTLHSTVQWFSIKVTTCYYLRKLNVASVTKMSSAEKCVLNKLVGRAS